MVNTVKPFLKWDRALQPPERVAGPLVLKGYVALRKRKVAQPQFVEPQQLVALRRNAALVKAVDAVHHTRHQPPFVGAPPQLRLELVNKPVRHRHQLLQ